MKSQENKSDTEIKKSTSKDSKETQKKIGKSANKMKQSQLMGLFEDSLKDIYWAEKALTKAIPNMIKNATSEDLKDALKEHIEETKEQIERLEKVFSLIDQKAVAEKCEAMAGLIDEASDIMESCEEGSMRDAGIISAAQKIEHYEIATYGTLRQFAETLNLSEVAVLLAITLEEEKQADLKLSEVAMDAINIEAAEEVA